MTTTSANTPTLPPRPTSRRALWRWAMILAFMGLACAVLLAGLSAWFLGAVAIAGLTPLAYTFNFHMPAALVRLFAVGRTAARYGERLVGHKAALGDQIDRRTRLFAALAASPATRAAGWQLGDQARLADYLDDVEDIDFAGLRVDLPAWTTGAGLGAALLATLIITPWAVAPILALLALLLLAARHLARWGSSTWKDVRGFRRQGARRLGLIMAAVVPLKGEGAWAAQSAGALASFTAAEQRLLALRQSQADFDAFAAVIGPLAAFSVIAAAWFAGLRGEALLIPVFLAFAWLALGEMMQNASRMVVAQLRRQAAEAEIAPDMEHLAPASLRDIAVPSHLPFLAASHLQRRAPNRRRIGTLQGLRLEAGRPTLIAGASGSGKTSLLKQLAGWVGDDLLAAGPTPLAAAQRRLLSFLSLHDAAILADTVRTNLFAPQASDDALWRALDAVELSERIREAGGLDGWISQDVLSLGEAQRLNLARAFLSDRPIVLLDEPSEHLDEAQGLRITERLLAQLKGRIVVLASHRRAGLSHLPTIKL